MLTPLDISIGTLQRISKTVTTILIYDIDIEIDTYIYSFLQIEQPFPDIFLTVAITYLELE